MKSPETGAWAAQAEPCVAGAWRHPGRQAALEGRSGDAAPTEVAAHGERAVGQALAFLTARGALLGRQRHGGAAARQGEAATSGHVLLPLQEFLGRQLPSAVTIVEVGPRDGLQNEPSKVGWAARASGSERRQPPPAPPCLAAL